LWAAHRRKTSSLLSWKRCLFVKFRSSNRCLGVFVVVFEFIHWCNASCILRIAEIIQWEHVLCVASCKGSCSLVGWYWVDFTAKCIIINFSFFHESCILRRFIRFRCYFPEIHLLVWIAEILILTVFVTTLFAWLNCRKNIRFLGKFFVFIIQWRSTTIIIAFKDLASLFASNMNLRISISYSLF